MAAGQKVVLQNGFWWRQVRPFFFRPLLTFREYTPDQIPTPFSSVFGGVQHVVPAPANSKKANSRLSFLMCENAALYTQDCLDYNRRRQLRLASRRFSMRPVVDAQELAQAHGAYLSFFDRTGYTVLSERRTLDGFRAWAEVVFQHPPVLVLGAYDQDELVAVSVSRPVEDTFIYSTFFARSEALKLHVSDLMLHSVREVAAHVPGIRQVFCGMHHGGQGTDGFYRLRGATLLTRPAYLNLNPATNFLLRSFLPGVYSKMLGVPTDETSSGEITRNKVALESKAELQGPEQLRP